ncbi:hypothetical protein AVEN_6635-1, partial [Araneus ventricosus]
MIAVRYMRGAENDVTLPLMANGIGRFPPQFYQG